jgi:hypothetical protein
LASRQVADAFCGLKRDGNIDVRIIRIHKRRGSPPDRLFVLILRTLISESARGVRGYVDVLDHSFLTATLSFDYRRGPHDVSFLVGQMVEPQIAARME